MCTLFLALEARPDFSLVLLSNRDEFHARASLPLHGWPDTPGLLAGKDAERGGIWLGVNRSGHLAALTNVREGLHAPPPHLPSRGRLGLEFLAREVGVHTYLDRLAESAGSYPGFNLLLGSAGAVYWVSNRLPIPGSAGSSICRKLEPGLHGLSNGMLNEPWPKVVAGRLRLKDLLAQPDEPSEEQLLDLMCDTSPAADTDLPDTGVGLEKERELSPLFIKGPVYGTRTTTLLLRRPSGAWVMHERTWGPDGEPRGRQRFEFMEEQQDPTA